MELRYWQHVLDYARLSAALRDIPTLTAAGVLTLKLGAAAFNPTGCEWRQRAQPCHTFAHPRVYLT
jgi:hypothetical protein